MAVFERAIGSSAMNADPIAETGGWTSQGVGGAPDPDKLPPGTQWHGRWLVAGMMEGKVAIVTGAGGGIGREIAIMMALAGAKVIVNDVGASLTGSGESATPAQRTQAIIRQNGGLAEVSTDSVAESASAR